MTVENQNFKLRQGNDKDLIFYITDDDDLPRDLSDVSEMEFVISDSYLFSTYLTKLLSTNEVTFINQISGIVNVPILAEEITALKPGINYTYQFDIKDDFDQTETVASGKITIVRSYNNGTS